MGTTKKANDDKDRKKADKGDRRRGRSRDRRSGAEAPKRKDDRKQKTRSRSRPRLRSAEAVSAERPTKTSSKEGKDHGRRTVEKGGGDHVSLTSDEESSESERPRVDDEAVDDDDADKEGDAATEPATAKLEPAAAASCPEGPGEGKDQVKEPTGAEAGRGPSKPRSKVSLRSATRPRSPQGPPPQTDASDRDNDNKHGKYKTVPSADGQLAAGRQAVSNTRDPPTTSAAGSGIRPKLKGVSEVGRTARLTESNGRTRCGERARPAQLTWRIQQRGRPVHRPFAATWNARKEMALDLGLTKGPDLGRPLVDLRPCWSRCGKPPSEN